MKIFYVLLLLSCFTAGTYTKKHPKKHPNKKRIDEEREYKRNKNRNIRIAGGTEAYIQDMPYMASFLKKSPIYPYGPDTLCCTTAIIHPFWVIAAEICLSYPHAMKYDSYIIRSNTSRSDGTGLTTIDHEIEVWYTKRLFMDSAGNLQLYIFGASLGLIKVTTEFKDEYEVPIGIAPYNYQYDINSRALQAGWGYTETGSSPLSVLRKVETRLADLKLCQNLFRHSDTEIVIVTDDMICAYAARKGACYGDTGGPLIQNGILIGVLGYSRECAADHWPDVYTNVAHFGDWIEQTIADDSNPTTPEIPTPTPEIPIPTPDDSSSSSSSSEEESGHRKHSKSLMLEDESADRDDSQISISEYEM